MDNHTHQAYEIYGAASDQDVRELRSYIDGLRQDLGSAEDRIRELERDLSSLRSYVKESAS